uniref:UDP-N-acetylglucosamine transferase subunit ALG14 n=1 Tax=Xiphophorus couchianus TaxID=32473 RepID=A0A3B5LZ54_9TELE
MDLLSTLLKLLLLLSPFCCSWDCVMAFMFIHSAEITDTLLITCLLPIGEDHIGMKNCESHEKHFRQTCSDLCQCYILEMCSALSLCVCVFSQVLCNGPGTCVPLCITGLLLRILGIKKVGIVYVESICRVQTLSLTGRILYLVSDYFFVQWSSLRDKYPKAIFLGRIV